MEVQVIAAINVEENGVEIRRFYPLELELNKINFLSLTWTVVHPINEQSPLFNLTEENLRQANVEIMILLKGFDDTFSQEVHKRSSYKYFDIVWGVKFVSLMGSMRNGKAIVDLSRISEYEAAN